jgi:hypothetical protein
MNTFEAVLFGLWESIYHIINVNLSFSSIKSCLLNLFNLWVLSLAMIIPFICVLDWFVLSKYVFNKSQQDYSKSKNTFIKYFSENVLVR